MMERGVNTDTADIGKKYRAEKRQGIDDRFGEGVVSIKKLYRPIASLIQNGASGNE
jgi:hypothetical protein